MSRADLAVAYEFDCPPLYCRCRMLAAEEDMSYSMICRKRIYGLVLLGICRLSGVLVQSMSKQEKYGWHGLSSLSEQEHRP